MPKLSGKHCRRLPLATNFFRERNWPQSLGSVLPTKQNCVHCLPAAPSARGVGGLVLSLFATPPTNNYACIFRLNNLYNSISCQKYPQIISQIIMKNDTGWFCVILTSILQYFSLLILIIPKNTNQFRHTTTWVREGEGG